MMKCLMVCIFWIIHGVTATYDEAKLGIFLHWGLFSVPAYGSEWFWNFWKGYNDDDDDDDDESDNPYARFVRDTERPHFAYPEYAPRFRAELYRPEEWVAAVAQAGAQYVVINSKHHDGFCTWDSRNVTSTWNWNVMEVGPKRDLLGDFAKEVRKVRSPQTGRSIHLGIYHSLFEWYNPMYRLDQENHFQTQQFVEQKALPELYDLV
jgi:alpha-L-fucosidase